MTTRRSAHGGLRLQCRVQTPNRGARDSSTQGPCAASPTRSRSRRLPRARASIVIRRARERVRAGFVGSPPKHERVDVSERERSTIVRRCARARRALGRRGSSRFFAWVAAAPCRIPRFAIRRAPSALHLRVEARAPPREPISAPRNPRRRAPCNTQIPGTRASSSRRDEDGLEWRFPQSRIAPRFDIVGGTRRADC